MLLNVLIILFTAIAVNDAFPWRRYPAALAKQALKTGQLNHADFTYALKEIGSCMDISEADFSKIYSLAAKHAWQLSEQTGKVSGSM